MDSIFLALTCYTLAYANYQHEENSLAVMWLLIALAQTTAVVITLLSP
jgi:hypothetical protein